MKYMTKQRAKLNNGNSKANNLAKTFTENNNKQIQILEDDQKVFRVGAANEGYLVQRNFHKTFAQGTG